MGWLSRFFPAKREGEPSLGQDLGRVDDYFSKVGVIALRLNKPLLETRFGLRAIQPTLLSR